MESVSFWSDECWVVSRSLASTCIELAMWRLYEGVICGCPGLCCRERGIVKIFVVFQNDEMELVDATMN